MKKYIITIVALLLLVIILFFVKNNQINDLNDKLAKMEDKLNEQELIHKELIDNNQNNSLNEKQLKDKITMLEDELAKKDIEIQKMNELTTENEKMQKEIDELKKNLKNKESVTTKPTTETTKPTEPTKPVQNEDTSDKKDEIVVDVEPAKKKVAYLTFDDGPSQNTLKILDILQKENIKATFFPNGKTDNKSKEIYLRTKNEGHKIGNHTFTHNYEKIYTSVDGFKSDFNDLNDLLASYGIKVDILRYPGGSNNKVSHKYGGSLIMQEIVNEMERQGYTHFDWNVDSGDASGHNVAKSKIVNNVINGSKNKDNIIILFHDTNAKNTTVESLPEIIKYLKAEGYIFETLSKNSYKSQFTKAK